MFRMGGAAEGITSGLDKPRQQYQDAGRVARLTDEFEQRKGNSSGVQFSLKVIPLQIHLMLSRLRTCQIA